MAESVAILVLHQEVIGIQRAVAAAVDVQAAPIVELAIVFSSALVVDIAWFILVTVSHIHLIILRVAVAAKHQVAGQQAPGCGRVAAKVAESFRKMNTLVAATAQQQVAAAALVIFAKDPSIRLIVLVSVQQKDVLSTTLVEENLYTWVDPLAAVAPNCNVVILNPVGMLLGEACVSVDSGTKVRVDGAAMTTTKAAMLDLVGSLAVVCLKGVFSKSTDRNLDATNGTTFTACVAAAVKATVLLTTLAIVCAATGIKVHDWP